MRCPRCNSTHVMKNGFNDEKRKYKCRDCGRQFVEPFVFAVQMVLPVAATPAPQPKICPKCGKPIQGIYRKGNRGNEHIVCPRENETPPRRLTLFESVFNGALIR